MQDLIKIFQENYLANFSCKILARFFISCKKSFIFSAKFARYVQDLAQDLASLVRKYLACKIYIFLARRFLLGGGLAKWQFRNPKSMWQYHWKKVKFPGLIIYRKCQGNLEWNFLDKNCCNLLLRKCHLAGTFP